MHEPNAVVAERTLNRCDTGETVVATVFKPVPDPEEPDATWACGYEITGLDERIRHQALGIDSMQALMGAFQAIRYALKEADTQVAFAETPGHTGFERHHWDPDMDALFENLIDAEVIRQNTLHELLDEDSDKQPATELMLEHVREAEAIRQRITRRILERARKRSAETE